MMAFIPVWVPVVFLPLLVIGYRQSVTRTVRPGVLVGVALVLLAISFYGVIAAFGPVLLAGGLWTLGYAASVAVGSSLIRSERMALVDSAVSVPGSWVPLVLMMGIFSAKFALGVAAGVKAPLMHSPAFVAGMSGLLGALSGGFGARAVAVYRFVAPARAAVPAR